VQVAPAEPKQILTQGKEESLQHTVRYAPFALDVNVNFVSDGGQTWQAGLWGILGCLFGIHVRTERGESQGRPRPRTLELEKQRWAL
jgi:hypothetical protein